MRIKLDENLPRSSAARLVALGHDVDTVLDENLGGRSDDDVWAAAQVERRFLVTLDLDLSDARRFSLGSHHGVLIVRLPTQNNGASAITSWLGFRIWTQRRGRDAWL